MRKTALIIGGSSGLGFASAEALAQSGINLYVLHRDARASTENLTLKWDQLKAYHVEVHTFNFDATRPVKIEAFVDQLSEDIQFDLVLHSIARGNLKPLVGDQHLSLQDYQTTLNAMALSFYSWAEALISANKMSYGSQFLAFTSEGNTKVIPAYGAISAAKATLESLMRQMAVEYASLGIRSNCIQAGLVDTPALQRFPDYEQLKAISLKRNPFKRLTTAQDVAGVVKLLAQPESNWINGSVIKVDGGESLV